MIGWFCSNVCNAESQKQTEMVFVNNETQQVFTYAQSINDFNFKSQQNVKTGYILLKQSLYDEYLKRCIKERKKFTDMDFPPTEKSLLGHSHNMQEGAGSNRSVKQIAWMRIPDIYKNSRLINGQIKPADILQGSPGDCYFLAAISALAGNPKNILKIFGKKSILDMVTNDHGIYKFIMNVGGQPEQIVVDDFIPVIKKSQRPIFCKPVKDEFWVILLEKAWAKVNGSYSNIESGNPHEVLNKFSVAPCFCHLIPDHYYINQLMSNISELSPEVERFQQNLWQNILQGHKQNFPMCCGSRKKVTNQGIREMHSYTLLGAYEYRTHRILKIRNPMGRSEYTGRLSESDDSFWNSVHPSIKNQIFSAKQNDGMFTMPFESFLRDFESVNISHCRTSYNYMFKSFNLSIVNNYQFFNLKVKEKGQVYVTFESNYKKDLSGQFYEKNGVSKILVAKQAQNGGLQFLNCALQNVLADVTIRFPSLDKGQYIVYVQSLPLSEDKNGYFGKSYNSYSTKPKKFTISTYSNIPCFTDKISPINNFVIEFLRSHAINHNKEKKQIGPSKNDWIAYRLLPQCGYGLIENSGFKLVYESNKQPKTLPIQKDGLQRSVITIKPGQQVLYIFEINFQKQGTTRLTIPPPGFEIIKVI